MDWAEVPNSSPHAVTESPRRLRCDTRLLALKRCALSASCVLATAEVGAALGRWWSCCSSTRVRRFRAAISERCVETDFLSPAVSARTSLRATRAISALRMAAMFGMRVLSLHIDFRGTPKVAQAIKRRRIAHFADLADDPRPAVSAIQSPID